MTEIIEIGDFKVEIRRSNRRRTVDLIVDRFGSLIASIPMSLEINELRKLIKKKELWIYSRLSKKEELLYSKIEKEYVTGEGFYYLGRKYRLKLVDQEDKNYEMPILQLRNGRFLLRRDVAKNGRDYFIKWYINQGNKWILNTVDLLKNRVARSPKNIVVRDLKFLWGSCTPKGDLYFHWRVMLLPPKIITYLILHELVHLEEQNHGPIFYKRLEQVAPSYFEIEVWLQKNGSIYTI